MTTPTTDEIVAEMEKRARKLSTDQGPFDVVDHMTAAILRAAASRLSEMEAENKRLREALTTIGHSLVCAPIDYAEHNAGELLRAGNIARAALEHDKGEPKP